MVKPEGHRRTAVFAAVAIVAVAILGGTAFAANRPAHPSVAGKHGGVTAAQVKQIVKSYVKEHATAQSVQFAATYDKAIPGEHVIKKVGPWTLTVDCAADHVSLTASGPGIAFGTNSLGATNGPAGSTFETSGDVSGGFQVGDGNQGSQTLVLRSTSAAYTVTYLMNSVVDQCSVIGYAIPLAK